MLGLLLLTIVGFSEASNTPVTRGYDKQAMSDATKHTQKETGKLIEVMNEEDVDTFAVEVPITDHGRAECLWFMDVTYPNGMFIGVIGSDPGTIINIEYGQERKIKKEDISDRMYTCRDKTYGSYTIDPLLVIYPKEEADELGVKLIR